VLVLFVVHAAKNSHHPMGTWRRHGVTGLRSLALCSLLVALGEPFWKTEHHGENLVVVLDNSYSLGAEGIERALGRVRELLKDLDASVDAQVLSVGSNVRILPLDKTPKEHFPEAESRLADGVTAALGIFKDQHNRRILLVSDGLETQGDLLDTSRELSRLGVRMDTLAVKGSGRPDASILSLQPSRARSWENTTLGITAQLESTLTGNSTLRLFENGVEVERRRLGLEDGSRPKVTFSRTPPRRGLFRYRAVLDVDGGDAFAQNNIGEALVNVQGQPLLLLVENDRKEAQHLMDAMKGEGLHLELRPAGALPNQAHDLAGYDGIILSDCPARDLSSEQMTAIKEYVDLLGGGLVMIGGPNSFGVGGYQRTPIEDLLPVKMQSPQSQESHIVALALVLDRSGSMSGEKIQICKAAALQTLEVLSPKDLLTVVAFDGQAHRIAPLTRISDGDDLRGRISIISADGGTNIYPGMEMAYQELSQARANIRHCIVMTDGQSQGGDYVGLSSRMKADGITISTVGIGQGADGSLLQIIASAGGGTYYFTPDPSKMAAIFTQDTLTHSERFIREQSFKPVLNEDHPLIRGWPVDRAPDLLGYIRTLRRSTAQVPLVTPEDDPLLAHWRYGLGKVTAFTSDAKSRWSTLWISSWPSGYSAFWAQVLGGTLREPGSDIMDLSVRPVGDELEIRVDLLESPDRFANSANVEVEVYHIPSQGGTTQMEKLHDLQLEQRGPGSYRSRPSVKEGAIFIVARHGARQVTASTMVSRHKEIGGGEPDRELLEGAASITGGQLLAEGEPLPSMNKKGVRPMDISGVFLALALAFFLMDFCLRRLENAIALFRWFSLHKS